MKRALAALVLLVLGLEASAVNSCAQLFQRGDLFLESSFRQWSQRAEQKTSQELLREFQREVAGERITRIDQIAGFAFALMGEAPPLWFANTLAQMKTKRPWWPWRLRISRAPGSALFRVHFEARETTKVQRKGLTWIHPRRLSRDPLALLEVFVQVALEVQVATLENQGLLKALDEVFSGPVAGAKTVSIPRRLAVVRQLQRDSRRWIERLAEEVGSDLLWRGLKTPSHGLRALGGVFLRTLTGALALFLVLKDVRYQPLRFSHPGSHPWRVEVAQEIREVEYKVRSALRKGVVVALLGLLGWQLYVVGNLHLKGHAEVDRHVAEFAARGEALYDPQIFRNWNDLQRSGQDLVRNDLMREVEALRQMENLDPFGQARLIDLESQLARLGS